MTNKPISPKVHGIIDYTFGTALIFLPSILGFNKKAKKIYRTIGTGTLLYSAITNYPAGLKPLLSFDTHRKLDLVNIGTMAAETFVKGIRTQKRALIFNLAATAIATASVLLTDWNNNHANEEEFFEEPEIVTVTEEVIIIVDENEDFPL